MLATLVVCGALLVVLPACAAAAPVDAAKDQGLDLLLIHTNDMHARYEETNRYSNRCSPLEAAKGMCFGGYARVAWQIKEARREAEAGGPAVLALNAGDTYQGSIYYNVFKWRMAAVLTNLLNFDAMSLGNHEFDDDMDGLVPFVREVKAPQLIANMVMDTAPRLKDLVKPSVVLDVRGTKVGVIGYVTPMTTILSNVPGVEFTDEVEALTAEAERLHADGVRIIIALGHSGYVVDKVIAEKVPHVDLVVGGHSHSFLYTGLPPDIEKPIGLYPTFVRQASGREVPVVQAYAYTKYLGRLRIRFDAEGEIASREDIQGLPVLLKQSLPKDADVEREMEVWRPQLDKRVLEPLGRTLTFLNGSCRARECNLGNLVADALVYSRALRYEGPGWTDAPIGMQNGGNVRASIDVVGNGTITLLDVLDACPFDNLLVIVYLRGKELVEVLETSVADYDFTGQAEKGGFMQYSGLRVTYDMQKAPGKRVKSVSVRCGNCSEPSFAPLDPHAVYGVVTHEFIVRGGDGYSMLSDKPTHTIPDITPYTALAEYIRANRVVYPAVEGRIKFVDYAGSIYYSGASSGRRSVFSVLAVLAVVWRSIYAR